MTDPEDRKTKAWNREVAKDAKKGFKILFKYK